MFGLFLLCLTIVAGLWSTDLIASRCRDEVWRAWLESGARGPGPDGLDRYGNSPAENRRRIPRIPD